MMAKERDAKVRSSALLSRFLSEPHTAAPEPLAEESRSHAPPATSSPRPAAVASSAPAAAATPPAPSQPPEQPSPQPSPEQLFSDVERTLLHAFEPPVVLALLEPLRKAIARSADAPDAKTLTAAFEDLEDILEVALFAPPRLPGPSAEIGDRDG